MYELIRKKELGALHGFTIAELEDVGCWGHKNALPTDLSCPIHRFYEKTRWRDNEKEVEIDIGDGVPGKWSIENPVVWNALVPCLRLATQILCNMKLFPL